MLAYNCSPSFNWKQHLDDATIAKFQNELGAMGFKFQFITLAGFHALNYSMFDLAHGYARNQMSAYVELQEREFAAEERGYTATKHQREVGAGYFDRIATTVDPTARPPRSRARPKRASSTRVTTAECTVAERIRRVDASATVHSAYVEGDGMNIERVGVVGAGQMGAGIAEVSLRAGVDVRIYEPTDALVTAGRDRIEKSLDRGVSKGKLSQEERDDALSRLSVTTTLADLSDRQLVIEAIVEDDAVKAKVFAELDEVITDPDAVLASNTSSIPIMRIAAATKNPGRVLGLHFFNPVPVLPLVELIGTLVTTDAALERTEKFASEVLGKQVVRCSDRSGFVVNALLVPYLLSAVRMVEAGFATHRGRRHRRRRGTVAPDGAAAALRPGRTGHPEAHRGQDVRGVQGAALRAAAAVAAHGRGGPAGQEVGPGLLLVQLTHR